MIYIFIQGVPKLDKQIPTVDSQVEIEFEMPLAIND